MAQAKALARAVGGEAVERPRLRREFFDAIINATPVGMYPHAAHSPLHAAELNCRLVFDLIYRPRTTKLLQLAARRGIETVSGVEMFVAQGTAQWEIWTGERAPEAAMRRVVLRALGNEEKMACAMIQPDFKTFSKLARQGNLVPVYETFTADLLTPVGAHLRLANNAKYSFLLESVEGGENIARYTFAGANPEEIFRCRRRECSFESGGKRKTFTADPIAYLRTPHRTLSPGPRPRPSPADRRRHRLFRIRHGPPDRKHSRHRPRRLEPR